MAAGRLLWRCRRGMKELDLLLEHYVHSLPGDAGADTREFERLLELPDPVLADYLLGQLPCADAHLAAVIAAVRSLPPAGQSRMGGD